MPTPPDLIDPFHKILYFRLAEDLEKRIIQLSEGSAATITQNETMTVAEKYAAQVFYIKAIRDVLAVCEDIERDRYGERGGRGD